MKKLLLALPLIFSSGCQVQQAQAATTLWMEAEKPKATDFPATHFFAPQNVKEADVLSGGVWIGVDKPRDKNLFLEYDVNLAQAGDYQLFARKFWKHGPFRWRIDNGAWHEVGKDIALLDDAPIRQFVGANWVGAGGEKITAGAHALRIELLEKEGAAAFDAFVLTDVPFIPRGRMKPGEKYNRAPQGWFAFEPDVDSFAASPIDLRYLNEKSAGENGFIQARGREFVYAGNGQRLRFWGTNVGHEAINWPRASIDAFARTQAKQGINLVRVHGAFWELGDIRKIKAKELDNLFYFVAALKREGIYSCISIYFPLWMEADKAGIPGYTAGQKPFDLLYFNPEFQEVYRSWWRTILTTKNPYTNVALKDEPAVAMCELVNEESHFFWTFTPYKNLPAPQTEMFEKQFATWLTGKYGTLQSAFQKWGANRVQGDDIAQNRAGFMPLWEIFNKRDTRSQDTAAFLALNQKEFYEKHVAFLKQELGYKGMVYGSNWTTASPQYLGPLDKWTNTVADFMDRHGYFGGPHEGPRAGYSISAGDKYDDRSALFFKNNKGEDDFNLPIFDVQNGKPSMISEINWPPPNRYRAEMPLLCAAYGSLQGSDAFIFFASGSTAWDDGVRKFSIQTPAVQAQFPAIAFAFRRALIQVAPTVVEAHIPPEDLLALKGAPVIASQNLDELRKVDAPGQSAPVEKVAGVDPLTPLVGRVELLFDEGQDRAVNLKPFIDRANKTVTSATGELAWDYGRGAMLCRAPGAQAVTGFLSKLGTIDLGDVTIQTPLDYGAITVIALDGQPLKTSKQILVQVMSEEKNYGWETSTETGMRDIKSIGAAPLVVKNLAGAITFKRADAAQLKIAPLDFNGYSLPQDKSLVGPQLSLRPNVLYYLVTA